MKASATYHVSGYPVKRSCDSTLAVHMSEFRLERSGNTCLQPSGAGFPLWSFPFCTQAATTMSNVRQASLGGAR